MLSRLVLSSIAALLLAVACGGSSKPAEEPETGSGSVAAGRGDDDETAESGGGGEDEAAPSPACNDETCFACGAGLCLKGMYCDVGAGPGCSWLPECAKSPSCACITKVLGDACKCDDSGGGPQVDCGAG